jgi:hypothetical protein
MSAKHLEFTFAIITDWEVPGRVKEVIQNIQDQAGLRQYEILVIGGDDAQVMNHLQFEQNPLVKGIPAPHEWITTKKNTAAYLARYNNIVLMHDYFLLENYWFDGYEEFGDDWDICSNPQKLITGDRHFTDWVVWDHPILPRYQSLDYWDKSNTAFQYISGGYFLVKRKVLQDNPFNATMSQGSPEDVEWSLRVRDKYKIRCNPYSSVIHNKIHRDARFPNL